MGRRRPGLDVYHLADADQERPCAADLDAAQPDAGADLERAVERVGQVAGQGDADGAERCGTQRVLCAGLIDQ